MNHMNSQTKVINELLRECGVVNPSETLREAISTDSNLSSDWLWYAGQLTSDSEQLYCYERALYIDPNDRTALRALEAIFQKQTLSGGNRRPVSGLVRSLQAWMHMPISTAADVDY
jgi:hypothetical protein